MKRNDTSRGRFYEIDGMQYPSVTTILQIIGKPALVPWAAKVEREMVMEVSASLYLDCAQTPVMNRAAWMTTLQARLGKEKAHKKEMEKAAEIGSQVHALVEWTLKGELCHKVGPSPIISDKAQWAFMAWEDWRRAVNLKPLMVEQAVWSDEHRYAGTMDLLAEVDGQLTVLDWKTGKKIYPEAYIQNAAYRHAVREMGHGDPIRGMVVRLPKLETDPEFEAKNVPFHEAYLFQRFLRAKDLWNGMRLMEAAEEKEETNEAKVPVLR